MANQTITLGMQTSGEDSITGSHVLALRQLLAKYCNGPFSEEVIEFAPILRVGGSMQEFDFVGCERLRRNRKTKYITVDIALPSKEWKGRTDLQIRTCIAQAVEMGLQCCLDRLRRDKVKVDADKLISDFYSVKERFIRAVES